jgi:hypothetical protein
MRLLLTIVVLLVGLHSYRAGVKHQHLRNLEGYGYAAEYGCLTHAQKACSEYPTDDKKAACREDALKFCGDLNESFKRFMSQS